MNDRERATLAVLGILYEGRMGYAQALREYARRAGVGAEQAADAFGQLVQDLIAEKLIDYEPDPAAAGAVPGVSMLWLRARGKALLNEGDASE